MTMLLSNKRTLAAAAALLVASVAGASCNPSACASSTAAITASNVCGSNGVTYSSQCELELAQCSNAAIQLASHSSCDSTSETSGCDEACDAHPSPICGSDGTTYLNACYFDRAYCRDHSLTPLGYGACAKTKARSLREDSNNSQPKYVEGSIV